MEASLLSILLWGLILITVISSLSSPHFSHPTFEKLTLQHFNSKTQNVQTTQSPLILAPALATFLAWLRFLLLYFLKTSLEEATNQPTGILFYVVSPKMQRSTCIFYTQSVFLRCAGSCWRICLQLFIDQQSDPQFDSEVIDSTFGLSTKAARSWNIGVINHIPLCSYTVGSYEIPF